MNVIFFWKRRGEARQLDLAHPLTLGVLGTLVLGIFAIAFLIGMRLGQGSGAAFGREPESWARARGRPRPSGIVLLEAGESFGHSPAG